MYYPDYSSSQQPLGRPPRPPRPSSSLSSGSGDSGFLPTSLSQGLTSGSSSPPPTAVAHHHINQLLLQETANLLALNAHLRRENERALSGAKMAAGTVPGMEFGRQTMAVAGVAFTCPPPILTTPNRHPGGGMLLTRSASSGSSGKKSPKPESYKTVMCAAWLESRTCVFAENCRFAHGEVELRPAKQVIRPNNKYRTKLCDKFTTTGLCPYGTRCLFIHPETGPNANAYIRSDKMVEINQRLAQASETRENVAPMLESVHKTMVNIQTTPLTSRSMLRPHPSWPLETPQFYRGTLQPENPTVEAPKSLLDYCSETESGARTPSSGGYCSGGEVTPESTGDASPFSTGSSAGLGTLEGLTFSSLDPFSVAIGNDNIAREMAKCLNPW